MGCLEIIKFVRFISAFIIKNVRILSKKILNWVADHDNKKIFIVLYISISLVLSIAISLFWLLFAVIIHFAFELISQNQKQGSFTSVLMESFWETKLDFALVIFAWWLAIYLDFIFGVAGIGAAARLGAQTASRTSQVSGKVIQSSARTAAWGRIIRAILLSLDDVGNAIKSVYQSKASKMRNKPIPERNLERTKANTPNIKRVTKSSWLSKWQIIDYVGVSLFLICLILIALAPFLIGVELKDIYKITIDEFHPLP